jgi:uncharacterized protein with HEPN domain
MHGSRTRLALEHIRDAIMDLRALLVGKWRAEFVADRLCQRGVERCLEVVSEASRRLPDELKAAHPEIAWRKVAGIGPASATCCATTTTRSTRASSGTRRRLRSSL